jgi:hypothetical protein
MFTIEVVCADAGHAGKRVKVATFTRRGEGWTIRDSRTNRRSGRWDEYRRMAEFSRDPERADATASDMLDAPASEVLWQSDTPATKYRLRCSLCGVDLQARNERIAPLLDALEAADVRAMPLAELVKRL